MKETQTKEKEVIEGNQLIAEFDGLRFKGIEKISIDDLKYHSSWDWLHPVYRKITEIGLWMMTNGHDKLWLEKSKEIDSAMLNEKTPEKAAHLIAQLLKWYNQQNNQ